MCNSSQKGEKKRIFNKFKMRDEIFVVVIRRRICSTKWKENFPRYILRHDGRCQLYENIAILNTKNLHFCDPTGHPLKTRQNERLGKNRCVLKLSCESVNHKTILKEVGDVVQNGLEDLRETAS